MNGKSVSWASRSLLILILIGLVSAAWVGVVPAAEPPPVVPNPAATLYGFLTYPGGEPVIGGSVVVEDLTKGTGFVVVNVTDYLGRYTVAFSDLSEPSGSAGDTVAISATDGMGLFESRTIVLTSSKQVNIVMDSLAPAGIPHNLTVTDLGTDRTRLEWVQEPLGVVEVLRTNMRALQYLGFTATPDPIPYRTWGGIQAFTDTGVNKNGTWYVLRDQATRFYSVPQGIAGLDPYGPRMLHTEPQVTYQGIDLELFARDPSGMTNASLNWRLGGSGAYTTLPMTLNPPGTWTAPLPPPGNGTLIEYFFSATDALGNQKRLPETGVFSQSTPPVASREVSVQIGWNLVSSNFKASEDPDLLFSDSAGDGATTWDRIAFYTGGVWHFRDAAQPAFMDDLGTIDERYGVFLHIDSLGDGVLTLQGPLPTTSFLVLGAGWNLIGYPANDTRTVANATAGITYTSLQRLTGASSYNLTSMAPSDLIEPGRGYWLESPAFQIWTVDWE